MSEVPLCELNSLHQMLYRSGSSGTKLGVAVSYERGTPLQIRKLGYQVLEEALVHLVHEPTVGS